MRGHPRAEREPAQRHVLDLQRDGQRVPPRDEVARDLAHRHHRLDPDGRVRLVQIEHVEQVDGHPVAQVLAEEAGGEAHPVGTRRAHGPALAGRQLAPPSDVRLDVAYAVVVAQGAAEQGFVEVTAGAEVDGEDEAGGEDEEEDDEAAVVFQQLD